MIASWRTYCLFRMAFGIIILEDLSYFICVTELLLLPGTFLLHLSETYLIIAFILIFLR